MSYEQGFIDKCAAMGVDPEALVKGAYDTGTVRKKTESGKSYRIGREADTRIRARQKAESLAKEKQVSNRKSLDIINAGKKS